VFNSNGCPTGTIVCGTTYLIPSVKFVALKIEDVRESRR